MTPPRSIGASLSRACLSLALFLGSAVRASPALADEAPTFADRSDETVDDATRSFAFMISPLALALGVFGTEADVVLSSHLAIGFEGDVHALGGAPAVALGAGLLLYPLRSTFHGPYVEPRVVFSRLLGESPLQVDWSTDVAGIGATAGWQWTWDSGLSVRCGAGVMDYLGGSASSAPQGAALAFGPAVVVVDASLGWAF